MFRRALAIIGTFIQALATIIGMFIQALAIIDVFIQALTITGMFFQAPMTITCMSRMRPFP